MKNSVALVDVERRLPGGWTVGEGYNRHRSAALVLMERDAGLPFVGGNLGAADDPWEHLGWREQVYLDCICSDLTGLNHESRIHHRQSPVVPTVIFALAT